MSAAECPPWCTTAFEHRAHEGLLYERSGSAAVTVDCSEVRPLQMSIWDQTGTGNGAAIVAVLDGGQARLLARVLDRIESWEDMAAFTKALTQGAAIVQGDAAPPTTTETDR